MKGLIMRSFLLVLLALAASVTAESSGTERNDNPVYSTECSMEWSRSWVMFSIPRLLVVDSIRIYVDDVDLPTDNIETGLFPDCTPLRVPETLFRPEAGSTYETDTNAEAFYITFKTDFSFQHDTVWAYIAVPGNNLRLTIPADARTYNHRAQPMLYEANVVLF